jgi:hypothetical protein
VTALAIAYGYGYGYGHIYGYRYGYGYRYRYGHRYGYRRPLTFVTVAQMDVSVCPTRVSVPVGQRLGPAPTETMTTTFGGRQ